MPRPIARIERAQNGYEVEMCDPKIKAQNEKSEGSYKDPYVSYVFTSAEEVTAFLEKNLSKATPMDEYDTSFEEAVKEKD